MSLLQKALQNAGGQRKSNAWAAAAAETAQAEELAELIEAWARGVITGEQLLRTLAPSRAGNPSAGPTLVLASIRRLVREGASLRPLDRAEE